MATREHDFDMCEECQVRAHRDKDRYCSEECEEVARKCKFTPENLRQTSIKMV